MNSIQPLFLIPVISGTCFFLAGWILYRYPPKTINWWYGYRTAGSMKSQKRWDFSQHFAGKELMKSSGILALISIPCWFMKYPMSEETGALVGTGIMILAALLPIYKTEKAIRQRFGNN
jgi:uncharacterized membrane protein